MQLCVPLIPAQTVVHATSTLQPSAHVLYDLPDDFVKQVKIRKNILNESIHVNKIFEI